MKAYGNLINRVLEHSLSPAPTVGMGATIHSWSDRNAATVIEVKLSKTGKTGTVILRGDKVTKWENEYGVEFAPNHHGIVYTATKKRNGTWKTTGGDGVTFGNRAAYYDRSF